MSQPLYPKPFDEEYRHKILEELSILDIEPVPEFDRVTWLSRQFFDVKIAVVSLVDDQRQFFLSIDGLDAKQTPREDAFCAHAIMNRNAFVVLDAAGDLRFKDNPLVVGPPYIRFYAGIPLVVEGAAIGTLCIIDDKPRAAFSQEEQDCLIEFAQIVIDEIQLRTHTHRTADKLTRKYDEACARAEAAETAKRQFLALMGHELRTPLSAIIGFADIISKELMGPLDAEQCKEFAEQIAENGRRHLGLVNRLLELVDEGQVDIQEETFDIGDLIMRCVEFLSGERLLAKVGIRVNLPKTPIALQGDPFHVEQIVLELVSNGIKFTPKGGTVDVDAGVDEEGCLVLTIIDTGIGIDESALDQAFSLFGQLSTGLSREFEGAGIGLPLVKKLAEMHGAELKVTAPSDGGTRAVVRFPSYRTLTEPLRRLGSA